MIRYTSLTPLTLLYHQYNLYACLTSAKSDNNDMVMKAPYDANLPFENFVKQIKEAIIIGDAPGTPYSACQIVTAA